MWDDPRHNTLGTNNMKNLLIRSGKLTVSGAVAFAVLQLIRPGIPVNTTGKELQAPLEVRHILDKDCYSCHSDQRRLSWFDQIVPAYWLVRHDILTARKHLNFSTLGSRPAAMQKATLYEAVNMIKLGAMPLPSFRKLHPEANVTPEELTILKAYLAPWTPVPSPIVNAAVSLQRPAPVPLTAVRPELNGFPFDPTFENWKLISSTDRGDNNTFRFILGNEIAMKASQTGTMSPWPDGTRLAKIAWQQSPGSDGLRYPGAFIQVELMLKDAQRFRHTEGWGWGRWRSFDLKPYGNNPQFVNECTGCHLPVRGNDYVYTLPITLAKVTGQEVVNNAAAMLPANLPYQPLNWSPITMYVDSKNHDTSILYGNATAWEAVQAGKANSASVPNRLAYPPGAVLALVSWTQREDPHWFGARIPDQVKSVEFVQLFGTQPPTGYRRFTGKRLGEEPVNGQDAAQRQRFMLGLSPAQLP